MKAYAVGDKVLFHVDVVHINPVEGEVVEIGGNGMYVILHKGLRCGVQEKFIVSKIIPDKEIIQKLEERILDDGKKLQILTKHITEANAKIEGLKEKVARQKSEIEELRKDSRKQWRGIFDEDFIKKIPRRTPKWRCDVDDHESYRQKYACGFLEY